MAEKVTHKAPTASGTREVEKSTSFGEDGIFFAKLAFQQSFAVFDNSYSSHINLKRDNMLILARREF
jgi:hypothetical protein